MSDVFSPGKRSEIMSAVRSKGNKSTELTLISIFRKHSILGWRRNYNIFGRPDFVFPKQKIAIFVDGCFWHGHRCRNVTPKQHAIYWQTKIKNNKTRDRLVAARLHKMGWRVIRLWECKLKSMRIKSNIFRILQTK